MQDRVQQLWVARGFRGCKGVYRGARQLLGDIGTWLFHLDRGSPRKVCLEDKNNIFRLYGVKKMGAEHFRAYLVIATEQVAEPGLWWGTCQSPWLWRRWSVRQVRACKLLVTGVCVDGESKEIVDCSWKLKP